MTSATFSYSSPDRQPRRSHRHRGKSPLSESGRAAELAIRNFKDDRRRRNRGDVEGDSAAQSALGRGVDALATGVSSTAESMGVPRWMLRGLVLAGIGLVLTIAVGNTLPSFARHSVSGVAKFNGKPLGGATLSFQEVTTEAKPESRTIRTGADGGFQIDPAAGLPTGIYTVSVWPAESGPAIPKTFRSPETTPLRFEIREDLSGMQITVTDGKQPIRKGRR